jgi:hypothetical protein
VKALATLLILLLCAVPAHADELASQWFGIWQLRVRVFPDVPPVKVVSISTLAADPPHASLAFACAKKGPLVQRTAVVGAAGFAAREGLPAAPIEVTLDFDTGAHVNALATISGALATIRDAEIVTSIYVATVDARQVTIRVGEDVGPLNVSGFARGAIVFANMCSGLSGR